MEKENTNGASSSVQDLGAEPTIESIRRDALGPSKEEKRQMEAAQKEMGKLFSEENWDLVLFAPADMRFSVTGKPHWQSEEKERKPIRQSVAIAMKCHFGAADPKWVATALACVQLGGFYATRIMTDYLEYKREKDALDRKEREEHGGA